MRLKKKGSSKKEGKFSLISFLCGVNCWATEIKGSFVSCPTFWQALYSCSSTFFNLFVGRCQRSIRDAPKSAEQRQPASYRPIWSPPLCDSPRSFITAGTAGLIAAPPAQCGPLPTRGPGQGRAGGTGSHGLR